MASKYDLYWAGQLPQIGARLERAAAGLPVVVDVPGLRGLGARQSWRGVAEVRGQQVTHSSAAHATSLGQTVAASGLCGRWSELAFRFTIGAAGAVLTITAAADRRVWPVRAAAGPGRDPGPAHIEEVPQPVPRAPGWPGRAADRQSDADEFYRLLGELAGKLGGPRRLRDSAGSSGWPRAGVYFFFEDGEARADGGGRGWVAIGSLYSTDSQPGSLDEYMKSFLKRATAGWVAVVLERAGVLVIDRSRPGRVKLSSGW